MLKQSEIYRMATAYAASECEKWEDLAKENPSNKLYVQNAKNWGKKFEEVKTLWVDECKKENM